MEKKILALVTLCIVLGALTVTAATTRMVIVVQRQYQVVEKKYITHVVSPDEGYTLITPSIEVHANVKHWRWIDGEKFLLMSYSHPANFTHYGVNYTMAKIMGHSMYNTTDYMANVTYISLGIDVGLNWLDTVLPGEWNRSTSLSPESLGIGNQNYTYSFYPSGSGTTNSTGLNCKAGIGKTFSLWAYDTFPDIDYTSNDQIDVEWQVIGPSAS